MNNGTKSPRKFFAKDGPTPAERRWAKVVSEWGVSGLRISEFCRRRGLGDSALRFWIAELPRRRQQRGKTPAPQTPLRPARPVRFVPARIVPGTAIPGSPLDVLLAGGRTVRVRDGFDPVLLRRLLAVLEDRS